MSVEQKRLFGLMAEFTIDTVLGWVSGIYKQFGAKIVAGDAFPSLIIPFAQEYFNNVARWIYSREDSYINARFDAMCDIKLAGENNPIDVLNHIVHLCLNTVNDMDIKDVISEYSYETSMDAVRVHLWAIVNRHKNLATYLVGCTDDHSHVPIGPNDKVYTFNIDKYAMTKSGPVKLTTLEL